MKLNKIQKERLQNIVAKMKDNMIDNLISEGFIDIACDVFKTKKVTLKICNEMAEEVLNRLFK